VIWFICQVPSQLQICFVTLSSSNKTSSSSSNTKEEEEEEEEGTVSTCTWLIDDQLARLFPISSHIPSAHLSFFFFLILLPFCCCCFFFFFFFFSLLLLLSAELYQIPTSPESQAIRAQESSG
jgi:hypothetical protein